MEIREPRYKVGDKVYCKQYKSSAIITGVSDYSFNKDKYFYNVEWEHDDYLDEIHEDLLEPYIDNHKTVWDLKSGDKCYFVTVVGQIFTGTWNNWNTQIENRKLGNVFLTKEEAEYELERRRIENEMLRLGGRRNFKKGELNWYIYFGVSVTNKNSIRYNYDIDNNDGRWRIYFDSFKDCSNAVKLIGEDKINKYLFGVEE